MAGKPAILFQNPLKTVTLLDIPRSIALAQGISENPNYGTIYSSPALDEPWPSTDPKSEKAKANVASHGMVSGSNIIEIMVQQARDKLQTLWKGDWCLERKVKPDSQEPDLRASTNSAAGWRSLEPLNLEETPTESFHSQDLQGRPVCNSSSRFGMVPVKTVLNQNTTSSPIHARPTCYIMPVSGYSHYGF